jgi:hypothetical protein
MADTEDLERRLTSRDISLLRVQASVTHKAIRDLRTLEKVGLSLVRDIDPAEPARRGDQFNRVTKVGQGFAEEARRTYRAIGRRFLRTQAELIEDESVSVVRLAQASGLPLKRSLTPTQAQEIAQKLLIDGATFAEDLSKQERGLVDSLVQRLRHVVATDGTLTEMVRTIRGEKALRYTNGLFRTYERHAQSTVATGMAGAANTARYETYVANADVVTMIQAINPLDGKTSDICRARAGRTWALRSGKAVGHGEESFPGAPPWHRRCRTTLMPLGRDDNPVRGQTFGGMLDSMMESDQKELLGPGKYELWRKGDIAMADLIDQSGRPLTLAQLRERID